MTRSQAAGPDADFTMLAVDQMPEQEVTGVVALRRIRRCRAVPPTPLCSRTRTTALKAHAGPHYSWPLLVSLRGTRVT